LAEFSLLREELRRAWHELRGAELSPARAAAAVGIGLFIGSQPIFGCHTPLVLIICLWFRLDAAICWVAANISNPFFAPALLTIEVQVGALVRTGSLIRIDHEFAELGLAGFVRAFAGDLFLGAPFVGLALAAGGGLITYGGVALKRRFSPGQKRKPYRLPPNAPPWVQAVERVAARYAPLEDATPAQKTRFHYVRTKLLGDPVARLIADIEGAREGVLGEVLDIGTGAGQLPILLLELGRATKVRGFDWDAAKVEDAKRAAQLRDAGKAAESGSAAQDPGSPGAAEAEFWRDDARSAALGEADTVMLIDLLHYFRIDEQDAILRRAAAAVRPGGRILVREADTEQGLRSTVTRIEEAIFTTLRFNRGERVRFRPSSEITGILAELGFTCRVVPAWGKTPFSNVLIVGSRAG
jgi:uncharacterized protein (DUF2062 family)/2-polyprenyl-3-methyl-5-hydroxy-6-metoxy-1,4-benzoquinol methylase